MSFFSLFSSKSISSSSAPSWKPLEVVGPNCAGKSIRVRVALNAANNSVINRPSAPGQVRLPAGAIGTCYAARGVLHVGFMRDFQPRSFASPTRYDYTVSFNFQDISKLEIST